MPILVFSPDVLYVKAKIMWVLRGDIFADPITGYDTMHPPWFHVILAPFYAAGIGRDTILSLVTVFNVALLFFFTYRIIGHVHDRRVAFWTCVMIPFIVEYMGPRNILLATSFYFSIPFYLAGLWLYVRSASSNRGAIGAAILWGLAFLISPIYLFLIGLTFVYEATIKRRLRRFLILVSVFAVMLIPFYVQLYTVYSQGLGEAQTFSLWRGIPGPAWWHDMAVEFISPTYHTILSIPAIAHMIILLIAIAVVIKRKTIHWLLPLSLAAFLLTFYHFSGQYAIRIQLFFSIFLIAMLLSYLCKTGRRRLFSIIVSIVLSGYAVYHHVTMTGVIYGNEIPNYREHQEIGRELRNHFGDYLEKESYIFCSNLVYLRYILPHYPVHALEGHRSMEYFQLPRGIAADLHADSRLIENSDDYAVIDSIAQKYGITSAIISEVAIGVPLYETLARNWEVVYQDGYFGILKKPE